jgi:hypothetical protein
MQWSFCTVLTVYQVTVNKYVKKIIFDELHNGNIFTGNNKKHWHFITIKIIICLNVMWKA